VVGGTQIKDQIATLNAGVDIVVATPGRLEDLISTGQLSLRYRYTVLPYWLIGWVDIVVATPGCLEDLISGGQLSLRYRYTVLPYWLIV
jgi:superfamily II DNA/RNA helicase